MPDELVEAHLPEAVAIVGQTAMPKERLERAPNLRAIVNVEGNFLPNVDYAACLDRGVHVLNASPAFARPVAEMALGMAIDLARGIGAADRAMRAGTETYGLESNADAFLLDRQPGRHRRLRRPRARAAPADRALRQPGQGPRPVAARRPRPPPRRRAGAAQRGARPARDLRVRLRDRRQRGLPRPRGARAHPPGQRVRAHEPRRGGRLRRAGRAGRGGAVPRGDGRLAARSRCRPTTRRERSRACCSHRTAPAACARRSWRSAGWPSPTSS